MCNIAEGAESGSTREFIRFLNMAKASAGEVRSDLYVAVDQNYISGDQFDVLFEKAMEVTRLIGGLRSSLLSKTEER
jgi:four helix bundle protein